MRDVAESSGLYFREIKVYRHLFPALKEIQGGKPVKLDSSMMYYSRFDKRENSCLILENLKALGYRVTDKMHGTDYKHSLLAVTSLANYHALTIAAVRKWIETEPTTGKKVINYPTNLKFLEDKSVFDVNPAIMISDWLNKYIQFTVDIQQPVVIFFKLKLLKNHFSMYIFIFEVGRMVKKYSRSHSRVCKS